MATGQRNSPNRNARAEDRGWPNAVQREQSQS